MDIIGILSKCDLLSIAEQAGAVFHKSNGEYRSHCPIHKGEDKNAFAVYEADGKTRWKCFSGPCGGGDLFDFVMVMQGLDFVGAYHWLGGEDTKPNPAEVERIAHERAEHARVIAEEKAHDYARALEDLRNTRVWLSYQKQLTDSNDARELWRKRGIPDTWQDWWKLGYCDSFAVNTDAGRWTTPTLTIPVFGPSNNSTDWPVMNIRHRLLNPPKPNDKYRPDRPGLQSAPYIANPFMGFDTDPILIVEGEIKCAVTFLTAWKDGDTLQVIGVPGKNWFRNIADQLRGHDVYILFDPDAVQQAQEAARLVGGKFITFPMKIDDAINAGALDRAGIKRLLGMGRRTI